MDQDHHPLRITGFQQPDSYRYPSLHTRAVPSFRMLLTATLTMAWSGRTATDWHAFSSVVLKLLAHLAKFLGASGLFKSSQISSEVIYRFFGIFHWSCDAFFLTQAKAVDLEPEATRVLFPDSLVDRYSSGECRYVRAGSAFIPCIPCLSPVYALARSSSSKAVTVKPELAFLQVLIPSRHSISSPTSRWTPDVDVSFYSHIYFQVKAVLFEPVRKTQEARYFRILRGKDGKELYEACSPACSGAQVGDHAGGPRQERKGLAGETGSPREDL